MSENGQDCFSQGFCDEAGGIVADERENEELPGVEAEGPGGAAESGERPDQSEAPVAPPEDPGVSPEARRRDLRLFVRTYPELKPEDVPKEVWERARRGESLVTAYMRYESGRLRQENERLTRQLRQRRLEMDNLERSAGSQLGSGAGERRRDPFEDGWEDAF